MIEVENLEKGKEKVNKAMAKSVYNVLNESYKDHNSSVYESINLWSLDRFSIGVVTNKATGKVDFKVFEKEDLREEISSRTGNFTIKNYTEDEKNSDLKLYITDVRKNDETSKELTKIYNENKGKSKDEIINKLIEHLEEKNVLDETAGNFVQAQEKENPITYSNLTDLELKMKESCIAKIIDEKGEEKYQSDNKSLSKIFEMKMADNPNFNEEYEKYSKADVSLLVLDKEDRRKLAEEINSILEDNKDIIESTKTKDKESNEINYK